MESDWGTIRKQPGSVGVFPDVHRRRQYGVREPHITNLKAPNGQSAFVITLFIPSEGAAAGESGELIYYKTY